jgi:hypothetical protein
MGTAWELDGKSSPPPLQKDKQHSWGACLQHPIGSTVKTIRNIPWGHVGAPHKLRISSRQFAKNNFRYGKHLS